MFVNMSRSSIALAAAMALGLALSACAHNKDNLAAGYGAAIPGSVQEFNQTVGDRVFFDTDQTDLSSRAQATLDKQAAWLNQYNKYNFTVEGHADERGTREYNFALGWRRARRFTIIWSPKASPLRASRRSATGRNGPSRCATTFPAGRRIAARSRSSTARRAAVEHPLRTPRSKVEAT